MQNCRVQVVHGLAGSTGLYRGRIVVFVVKQVHLQLGGGVSGNVRREFAQPRCLADVTHR